MRQSTCRYWGVLILVCVMALSPAFARPLELGIDYSDLTPAALKKAMSPNLKGYRIGIALSGGGARGFAHVGVLDELEKSGIEIDVVAGTSMGGIVGGLYASGMTPEEIREAALQIRWNDFFSDKPQRGSQLFTRRAEVEGELLTLRFDGLNPRIPTALSSGQKLVNVLSSLTLTSGYFSNGDFAKLERKLAVVATDIVTGEKVVFEGGSLIDALRATMSVPLAFTPVESNGQLLMDGGLAEPVPTQTLREIGADFVIAVDVTSDLMPAKEISDPIDIAGQVTTILSAETRNRLLSDADFVITPDLRGIKATAFEQGDSTIERGRRATNPRIMELKRKLSQVTDTSATVRVDAVVLVDSSHGEHQSQNSRAVDNLMELRGQTVRGVHINQVLLDLFRSGVYAGISSRWDGGTLSVTAKPLAAIAKVNFDGNQLYEDSVLLRESGFSGESITSLTQLQELYASILSFYRRNGYDLAQVKRAWLDTTRHELEVELDEGRISGISVEGNDKTRWWVVNSYFPLRPGDFYSKFRAMSGVQYVYASGLFDNVNLRLEERNGGVWITIVVKERPFTFARLSARYHEDAHPECLIKTGYANLFGTGNEISMAARFSERRKLYQLQMRADRIFRSFVAYDIRLYYANDKVGIYHDNRRTMDRTDKRWGVKFGVGQQLWKRGLFDVTARFEGVKYQFSNDTLGTERRVASIRSNLMVDTRDRFTFPTSGRAMRLSAEIASDVLSADEVFKKFEGIAEAHLRLSRYANIHPRLAIGLSEDDMPVYEKFRLGGSRNFFGYAVDQLVGDKYFLGNFEVRFGPLYSAYMSFRYDAGQVFGRFEEVRFQGLRHSYGAALAVDTPVGPLSISYGRAEAKYDRIYLNLGYDF